MEKRLASQERSFSLVKSYLRLLDTNKGMELSRITRREAGDGINLYQPKFEDKLQAVYA